MRKSHYHSILFIIIQFAPSPVSHLIPCYLGTLHHIVHRISRVNFLVIPRLPGGERQKLRQVWHIRRRPLVGSGELITIHVYSLLLVVVMKPLAEPFT